MVKEFKGYIIGRKLYDFDGKLKSFSYYPRIKGRKPPYWYKTKSEAIRVFNWQKEHNKFPGNQSDAVVVKFTKRTYLDRY